MFTPEQARAEGWSDRRIRRRRETGAWRALPGRGLTAVRERPPTGAPACGLSRGEVLRRAWGVALTWPDRVISHAAAATLLGWPVPAPDRIDVLAPRPARGHRGLRIHVGCLDEADVTCLEGPIWITSAHRTALDCLAGLPIHDALDLYAWLTTRRLLRRRDVRAAVRTRTGEHGVGRLLRLLRITRYGAVSGGEYELHLLLRAAGIDGWRANVRIPLPGGATAIADLLFAQARLIVELDGRRAHTGAKVFVSDRRRQNALQREGYLVLRYTWADLVERPDAVVAEVRAVVADRTPHP